jgi:hypothetical protein
MFGRAIEHTVGRFWTDRAMASRVEAAIYDWARLTTFLHNTEEKLQRKGIKLTRVVPPKIALPLLEHATMEHEDDLHELWEILLTSALDPSEEEIKRMYVSILGELSAKDAQALKRLYAEWLYWDEREVPNHRRNKEHRYSSGIGTENDESAVLFYRLGLVLPVHVTVEEYRSQSAVTQNNWSRHDPPYYVEGGDKTLVLGDLTVVGLTEFGEKFCNAVIGDVSGLYDPPDWAKELKTKGGAERANSSVQPSRIGGRFCSALRPPFRGLTAIGRRPSCRAPAAPASAAAHRADDPAFRAYHARPERRHRYIRPRSGADDRLVVAGTRRRASELRSPACCPASLAGLVR